ncbi:MAG: hypothetical protein Q9214_000397 [Letrouitia sp. 1 TL-2023]
MLEVDTRGKDECFRNHQDDKDHICDGIRILLPRLRHLRLRIGKLCSSIIDPNYVGQASSSTANELTAAPNLVSLTLNLNVGLGRRGVKHCHGTDTLCRDRSKPIPRPTDALLNELAMTLGRAQRAGKFSSAQKLQIIGEGVQDDNAETGCIILQDCLNRRTHILPYVVLGMEDYDCWMVRTISGEQFFGGLVDIEEKIEGPVWDETIKGERFPASEFKNSERAVGTGVIDRNQFLKRLGGKLCSTILVDWEQCKDRSAISVLNSDVIPEEWLIMRS